MSTTIISNQTDGEERCRKDIHNSDVPLICQSCEARHKGICGALSPDQLVRLSKHSSKTIYEPNAELRREEQAKRRYANVLSGVVKLTKTSRDGRQQIVGLQFAPDFMGRPFTESSEIEAIASTNVRLCTFPVSVIEKLIDETPALERRIYQQTMAELDEAREWLFALGRKSAHEKVASFLLLIATHADPEQTGKMPLEIELPLKRADIADFLGLTIETVSRQITNLRKAGIIKIVDRHRMSIPSLSALRKATCVDS